MKLHIKNKEYSSTVRYHLWIFHLDNEGDFMGLIDTFVIITSAMESNSQFNL